jgi:hypothetical protein
VKREDVHRAWAPDGEPWSRWVKPVLFANLHDNVEADSLPPSPEWLRPQVIEPLRDASSPEDAVKRDPYREDAHWSDAAIVIDLPGEESALVGIALVEHGFRPIPLYNALPAEGALIDLRPTMRRLVDGAERVATAAIGARPAFLLDAHRAQFGHALGPGTFDNRSVCFESDFPSANLMLQAGIRRVLLIQQDEHRPDIDIESVLFTWQHGGLQLWRKATRTPMAAAPFVLQRRSWLARAAHYLRRRYDNLVQRVHLEVEAGPGGG